MKVVGSGVSCGDNNYNSLGDCFLSRLVDNTFRTGNVFVTTERDVQNPNVVTLAIGNYPPNPFLNVFFGYATSFTYFDQDEFAFVRQSAINAVTEMTIARCGNRDLCPVPQPRLQRLRQSLSSYIMSGDDATHRRDQVGMRIKTGIKKGYRYIFAGVFRVRV